MVQNFRRILLICAATLALVGPATSALALQEAAGATSEKVTTETPVKRTVRFESKEAQAFKHKLEIYNRAKANSDRLYCREDRMTGSHRKKMRCVTYQMKQQEEDAARAFLRAVR